MNDKVKALASKAENAIGPAAALITFIRTPLAAVQSGGLPRLINFYKTNFINWHPPTLTTFTNLLEGDMGIALMTGLAGGAGLYFANFVPDGLGIDSVKSAVSQLLRALVKGAAGTVTGLTADAFIHPTKYNPDGASLGTLDHPPIQHGSSPLQISEVRSRDAAVKPRRSGGVPR